MVALSAYEDDGLVWGMLEAEAVGYVLKDEPPEAILAAVRAAARGEAYFSPEIAIKVAAWVRGERPGGLTERELEVLGLLARGLTNRQIALALGLSEKTVEKYIGKIREKLGVSSRVEAAVQAVKMGWVGKTRR